MNHREGFKLTDPKKINQIFIMNYFFILGDVLIVSILIVICYTTYSKFSRDL